MGISFWLPIGHVLKHGDRQMRFEEALGQDILRFRYVDGDEEVVLVPCPEGEGFVLPTVKWILAGFRAGNVVDPDFNREIASRSAENLHLDRSACLTIDPKCGWRFDWAEAATRAGITKTEDSAKAWISQHSGPGSKPSPRSLLRWMQNLARGGGRIGALVSAAGRQKGQSQLSDLEDRLVHKWALRYWRPNSLNGRLAHKEDAAAQMQVEWDLLKEKGVPGLGEEAPSSETMRKRINSLECYSTHASRFGRASADRLYSPSGEPVPIEQPFERIFMDGVEWEHSVYYSDALQVPAAKMKSVIAMDGFSQFVFPHPTFAGQFRAVWGEAALRGVMMPPQLTQEEFDDDPERALFYGLPSDVMYDRDRTMISPSVVPGAIKLFSTAELAQAYHHDAKSKLENYHKFVKASLAEIPGRILGARSKYDIGYNPLKDTEVTRAQYRDLVEQCRLQWNDTPKRSLGDRSPNDVMRAFLQTGGPRLTDPQEVMRTFASTPSKNQVLTTDGLTFDNVHYRFNTEGVGKALSSNHHNTPFSDRLKGTAKILVSIRVWNDDIDKIEVYDDENKTYFPMWSTEPTYTGGLGRWEHQAYQKYLKSGGGGATTKRDKLRCRAKYLDERQKALTGLSFREREEPVELLEAEERRLSGQRAQNTNCAKVPELSIPTRIDAGKREDIPQPPPQPSMKVLTDGSEGADDVRSDPSKEIARELGDDLTELGLRRSLWDFSDGAADEDEEDTER
jgi:hypothetical protein